jgi:hypothetical protein
MELLLTPSQGAYRSADSAHSAPNHIWDRVVEAFVEESGMALLTSMLDVAIFADPMPDKVGHFPLHASPPVS